MRLKDECVEMSHGAGGKAMQQLIEKLFYKAFANDFLMQKNDQADLGFIKSRILMSTDSYVVSPLFFPGGNIGSLAVNGTVNDIAMGGGVPQYLSAGFILEEGMLLEELKIIVESMAHAARTAGVSIVTGDTKVVERGKGDGLYINTTGVGWIPTGVSIHNTINPGDKVIINGCIGDHGMAVMSKRENLSFVSDIESDSQALNDIVQAILREIPHVNCLRDPTRGGLATVLNEWACQYQMGFAIDEAKIPVKQNVMAACELLGLDPLYVANEGKFMLVCAEEYAETVLQIMQCHEKGKHAAIIGEAICDTRNLVQLNTHYGGERIINPLVGDQLPRIC